MVQFQQMETSQHLKESNLSKVKWIGKKKKTCNLCSLCWESTVRLPGEWYPASVSVSVLMKHFLALLPWKRGETLYPVTFFERLLSLTISRKKIYMFRVAEGCPTLPDHKKESHKKELTKPSLSSHHSLDKQLASPV